MISFTCNICGAANTVEEIPWEPSTCAECRSNVRMRALIYMLSAELYGQPRPLPEFHEDKSIRGFGLSDDLLYAVPLAGKFDYANTFYDREPYLDITQPHPDQYGTYDFILSSDVFEHVAPPVERAFSEALRLLKPNGFLCITVPSAAGDGATLEHFPELNQYAIVELAGEHLLINRKRDKSLEIHESLEFHGGIGATLVMRQFTQGDLARKLVASGFKEACFLAESVASHGIQLEAWSRPLVARKERYALSPESALAAMPVEAVPPPAPDLAHPSSPEWEQIARLQEEKAGLAKRVVALESQLHLAADSRWLRLGRKLGFGPKFQ